MEGLPPTLVVPIATAITTVIAAMVAQAGANWIQAQRRREARETKEIDLTDRREDRMSKEGTELRQELRQEIERQRQVIGRLESERDTKNMHVLQLTMSVKQLEWERDQLRDKLSLPPGSKTQLPETEPPPGEPPAMLPTLPPTAPGSPGPDGPQNTAPLRRPPGRH